MPRILERFLRGWVGLALGCVAIVIAIMGGSELYLWLTHRGPEDPGLRWFFVIRGTATSLTLAAFAGWFVYRACIRIEITRAALRAQANELRERELRIEQRLALDAASRIFAHEIRNPLNNMLLNCTRIERAMTKVPESARDLLFAASSALKENIARLEQLSRGYVTDRGARVRRDVVHLEAIASDVAACHQDHIAERKLRVAITGSNTTVRGDSGRIRHLMHTLFRNAVEAVDVGGSIHIDCRVDGKHARLDVVDDGPGFADLARAFQPFYTTKEHGAGLGLAVVRDISELHSGYAEASNRSRGACVSVFLPQA